MDKQYLKSLRSNFPDTEYIELKREILDTCKVSKDVWKNWMNGRTKIPILAVPIIKEIVRDKLAKNHPGQSIQYVLNL